MQGSSCAAHLTTYSTMYADTSKCLIHSHGLSSSLHADGQTLGLQMMAVSVT